MPGGHAYRPGDIVTALNGKTIEVTNTDAEGRLVLADALWHARQRGATHILDLATLTGAIVVALGDFYAGLFGNDEDWSATVRDAAQGERRPRVAVPAARGVPPLPRLDLRRHEELLRVPRRARRSSPRASSQEFVGEGPWAHLDIAGTAFLERGRGDYYPSVGATGTACGCSPSSRAASAQLVVNFDLSDEHELLRSTVREFAEQRIAPVAEELDREHRFPYEIVAELAELGLMGIPIPEEYGGAGGDTLAYAIAIEELTRIDSSVAITVAAHTSLGTMPIFLFGTEEQKREWLPDLASGRRLAAFGLTEPERRLRRRRDADARRAPRRRRGS